MVADAPPAARLQAPMRRHLEGWQLGLLAVVLPVLALWLALPRPVAPAVVPLPDVDRAELERIRTREGERAHAAATDRLSFAVRRVGETMRRLGGAASRSDAGRLRNELRAFFRSARRAEGSEGLLRLRALQTQLFLAAVRRFQAGGRADAELTELGGNFEERARRSGWLDSHGRLVFSEAELFALYRVRWTDLVGALDLAEFRPRLQELRIYYRALLEHPEGANAHERDSWRLAYVSALEERDPEYPAAFARGVLQYRLGRPNASAAAFMEHLGAHPDGPYALRARNYLLGALASARTE